MLTPKQAECLAFIKGDLARTGGVAPSVDEIREAMGFASKATVVRILRRLEERGAVRRLANRARAIEIVAKPSFPVSRETPWAFNSSLNVWQRKNDKGETLRYFAMPQPGDR